MGILNDVSVLQVDVTVFDYSLAPSSTIETTLLSDFYQIVDTLTVLGHIVGSTPVVEASGTSRDKVGSKSHLSRDVLSA